MGGAAVMLGVLADDPDVDAIITLVAACFLLGVLAAVFAVRAWRRLPPALTSTRWSRLGGLALALGLLESLLSGIVLAGVLFIGIGWYSPFGFIPP